MKATLVIDRHTIHDQINLQIIGFPYGKPGQRLSYSKNVSMLEKKLAIIDVEAETIHKLCSELEAYAKDPIGVIEIVEMIQCPSCGMGGSMPDENSCAHCRKNAAADGGEG